MNCVARSLTPAHLLRNFWVVLRHPQEGCSQVEREGCQMHGSLATPTGYCVPIKVYHYNSVRSVQNVSYRLITNRRILQHCYEKETFSN